MTDPLPIRVEVPVCAFRPYASREYQDTYPVPTPATVYGMLLSLVGEPPPASSNLAARHVAKEKHRGAEMALAVRELPGKSKVLRKLRRGRDLESTRPDYQDLLIDLSLWVWLRRGDDAGDPPLVMRVRSALERPSVVERFGGLSLGESSYLVDIIAMDAAPPDRLIFVTPDERGFYSLPVWVDHSNSRNTLSKRFSIGNLEPIAQSLETAWFKIGVL